jgi:glutathione peroxidase
VTGLPQDLTFTGVDGRETRLDEFAGRVLLIVNTASRCGFTPQYAGLEALHRKYRDAGLTVLGFPCNQFGAQEPGGDAEIARFCAAQYGVTFFLSRKVDVNGANAHPLFRWLKRAAPGVAGSEGIKWNFTKFLVGRDGRVAGRYAPFTPPEKLEPAIRTLLEQANTP